MCCLGVGQQVLSRNRVTGVVYEQDNRCCLGTGQQVLFMNRTTGVV